MVERRRVRVTGTVQGVGFRPFVYREATALRLAGSVRNDSGGVLIEVQGPPADVDELCRRLADQPPPLAHIARIDVTPLPVGDDGPFAIVESDPGGTPDVPVAVDSATCPACLGEVDDPGNRRFGYPFTNCTDCGPRYTIVRAVPYDRPATTMSSFLMCDDCRREFDDPADRRFHAQPNACPVCGPTLRWGAVTGAAALDAAVDAITAGEVVAVKGLGGYHLAVDATNADAVALLRRRKQRDDKPFALMVADIDAAARLVDLDDDGAAAMCSPRRPIVLASRAAGAGIPDEVAPGLSELGVMLPYTPLHHLILARLGRPLVLTSGNLSDEPIAHTDDDARTRLAPIAGGILSHDRPIHIRCDDSVVRATPEGVQVLRRSRGYAPEPVELPFAGKREVLAVGAELKSTVALTRGSSLVVSHHIGDLEHLPAYQAFVQASEHLCRLFGVRPAAVAHDLHPEYLSTKFAGQLDLPAVAVQHHHAHVVSCMVDNQCTGPVLGVAFDGHGWGPDGTLWGGEFLVADLDGYQRVGHLKTVALPGGAAAIKEPWRMAVSWCGELGAAVGERFDPRAEAVARLANDPGALETSSAGRLFDAAAALITGRAKASYEGQAAMELEALASPVPFDAAAAWPVAQVRDAGVLVLDPSDVIVRLASEAVQGDARQLAATFHASIGAATAEAAATLAGERGLGTVALSGGVFQNARLTAIVARTLRAVGLDVLVHRSIPPNDGGISVGQAAIAAYRDQ